MRPRWHRVRTLGSPREYQDIHKVQTRGPDTGTMMASQRESKIAKMAPRWHGVRTLGAPREDQDGPTSDTRGQAAQRQSKMLKMTPSWHRVSLEENWGVPEKTKMVQQKTQEDFELPPRWQSKDK